MFVSRILNVGKRLSSVEYGSDFGMYPEISTNEIPGPVSKCYQKSLHSHIDMRLMNVFADVERSYGNFLVDVDGNTFLDLHQHFSSLPFGYNYELFENEGALLLKYAINRFAMGVFPPEEYLEVINDIMEGINTGGLDDLIPLNTGAECVENAIKLSTIFHHSNSRGGNDYSEEQLSTCMNNQIPGSSNAVILSFEKGFHGRSLGANTCTTSKQIAKLDVSAFDWPIAPFPQLLYPLNENASENREEEDRCLSIVQEIIYKQENVKGRPVAGLLIEPIQSDGGDRHTTPYFFQQLQKICSENEIALILDEVQTGIAITGKMWCFQHFNMDDSPDILCFSKKAQLAGVLSKKEKFRPQIANRVNSTWHGDMLRAKCFQMILREIEEKRIMEQMKTTGEFLMDGLEELSYRNSVVENIRGLGCFIGFDCDTVENRDTLKEVLRQNGVLVNISGERAIRLRPCLRFTDHHASIFMEILEKSLERM